ncbi:MAG TPA: undecaprenyl-diphosphate phosphatase [Pseudomonadaceae bacterium]|nr:undecaprenyl-diphosphate phosphatase [Pseudomonadaceae bacterium]
MLEFDLLRATILALIQGLTEFLPISSSAHLLLPSILLGWEDQGLAFDVAVHFGTLLAVIGYFRHDIMAILRGMIAQAVAGQASAEARLGWSLAIATVPVIIAGFLLKDVVDQYLRDMRVVAATTIVFGLLLWVADRKRATISNVQQIGWRSAVVIGLAQILALVPGTSRSGITTTAALFCGLDREAASRFSFLLSIPVIAGAALFLLVDLLQSTGVNWGELAYALLLSMLTAWGCIHYFLKFIARVGFLPFVVYRVALGLALLYLL